MVADYQDRFLTLLNRAGLLSEQHQIQLFTMGLSNPLLIDVELQCLLNMEMVGLLSEQQQIQLFTMRLGDPLLINVELQCPFNMEVSMSVARAYELHQQVASPLSRASGRPHAYRPPTSTRPLGRPLLSVCHPQAHRCLPCRPRHRVRSRSKSHQPAASISTLLWCLRWRNTSVRASTTTTMRSSRVSTHERMSSS